MLRRAFPRCLELERERMSTVRLVDSERYTGGRHECATASSRSQKVLNLPEKLSGLQFLWIMHVHLQNNVDSLTLSNVWQLSNSRSQIASTAGVAKMPVYMSGNSFEQGISFSMPLPTSIGKVLDFVLFFYFNRQ